MSSQNCNIHATNATPGIMAEGCNITVRDIVVTSEPKPRAYYFIEEFRLPVLNKTFKGRDPELKHLNSLFFEQGAHKVVVSGIPGCGKTELAKQFASKCKENNLMHYIVWIKAENSDDLEQISGKLQYIYDQCKEYKILFVFDNGTSRKTISIYEPPKEDNYYMLVTSREKDWHNDVQTFPLENLSSEAALEVYKVILSNNYEEDNKHCYEKLAEIVNNVPLGIQITGSYIDQQIKRIGTHFSLQNYVQEVVTTNERYIDVKDRVPNEYEHSLHVAVDITIKKIYSEENIELRDRVTAALFTCSFLNPEEITVNDLLLILTPNNVWPFHLMETLSYIDNFSLIQYDINGKNISIHRLIQQILRYHLNTDDEELKSSCYSRCLEFYKNAVETEQRVSFYEYLIQMYNSDGCGCADCLRSGYDNDSIHTIIFKYADENFSSFFNFYLKYNNHPFMYWQVLPALIYFNCTKSIKAVIDYIEENEHWFTRMKLVVTHAYWDRCKYIITKYRLMHCAARYNNTTILELFHSHYGVNINVVDDNNATPLHVATINGNFEAIEYLVNHEADLNCEDFEGYTPLFKFCESKYYNKDINKVKEILDLLQIKKNINKRICDGASLLHISASSCRADLIELLLTEYGLDANTCDKFRRTPLKYAINSDNNNQEEVISTVKTLKQYGARPEATDKNYVQVYACEKEYLMPYLTT